MYQYIFSSGKLLRQTIDDSSTSGTDVVMDFFYDGNGQPYAMDYNGTMLFYVLNAQGDVVRLVTDAGTSYATYRYDAWGNIIQMPTTIYGEHNPLRYRGYVTDDETGMYYLQSRYYDPAVGRFINADSFASTGQGFLGYNMFAYCNNNPVNLYDSTGESPWVIVGIIVVCGVIGGVMGYVSEEKLIPDPSEIIPNIDKELKHPSKITEDDLVAPEPPPREPLTTRDRIINASFGTVMGIAIGGLLVSGIGAGATVAAGTGSVVISAFGTTGIQTFAFGALIYDLIVMVVAPFLPVAMEPVELTP